MTDLAIIEPRHLRDRIAQRERERDEIWLDLIEAETEGASKKAVEDKRIAWDKHDAKVKALKKKLAEVEG